MTTFLAVWGAVVSTLLAIWSIHKDLRDRGNVRVEAYLSIVDETDEETRETKYKYDVEITLTNIGSRSVIVTSVGAGTKGQWRLLRFGLKSGKGWSRMFFDIRIFPKRLEPGEFVSITRDNLYFLKEKSACDYLFAMDSLGRYYFLPKADLDRMRQHYGGA
jgi:hypothetical protein